MEEITEYERLLRLSGLMTLLRDDLEELHFKGGLKEKTRAWLIEANKRMKYLAGSDKENKELIGEEIGNLSIHYGNILRVDDERRDLELQQKEEIVCGED